MRQIRYTLAVVIAVVCVLSACHHGKHKKDKQYMNGYMYAVVPEYVLAGSEIGAYSGGINIPTSGVIYRWTFNYNTDTIDSREGGIVYFTVPDTIGKFQIVHTAMADGYYNAVQTFDVNTIIPYIGGSLKDVPLATDSIQDGRDGQWYYIEEVGNLVWFSENLNFAGSGAGYAASDDAGYVFGRLYTWEEATGGLSGTGLGGGPQGACPAGWKVPTNEDWEDLAQAVTGKVFPFLDKWEKVGEKLIPEKATFNGERLWPYSANTVPTNDYKWNALTGGYCYHNYKQFYGMYQYAFFWSATEKDNLNAYYRYIYYDSNAFPFNYAGKQALGASVRCVKLK